MREKILKPTVGFCGYSLPLLKDLYDKVKHFLSVNLGNAMDQSLPGNRIRAWCLTNLINSSSISTNFVIRDQYFGGAITNLPNATIDITRMQMVFREYLDNMVHSDYIVCVRGAGNFSFRLYETLCCGRIPILIDTDCALPYDHIINWDDFCIRIKEKEIPEISTIISNFHESITKEEFLQMQQECRQLWIEWLSPEGFFKHFQEHFSYNSNNGAVK
jgi:hypothetical protein